MNSLRKCICLSVMLFLVSALHAQELGNGPVTTDEEFFSALNLDTEGMDVVKVDVGRGDYKAATHDFVAYLRNRNNTKWFFDWRDYDSPGSRDKDFNLTNADKYASNLLVSCTVWHQFGDTVDWSINPTELKYNEWTWQLSRHPFWVELGKAYWATGDEKYARAYANQIRSWIVSNPIPDFMNNEEYSRWRTIESGIRMAHSWPYAFYYFLGSPSLDDELIVMIVKSFYEHGKYLRKYNRDNNWLTMEMDGLFYVALTFPEFKESGEWAEYASSRLFAEEKKQFYPDGAQIELAPGYHWVSVSNIMKVYRYAALNGYRLPDGFVDGLLNTCLYYVNIASPSFCMPAVNDSGWGSCSSILQTVTDCFQNPDIQYIASGRTQGKEPSFKSVWMPWAGWYAMRSGWDADARYSFFEVGPTSPAHQHEDKLSFIINAYGERLLSECGTYAYDTSQWREYALSTRAHNVTRVDGKDQYRVRKHIDEVSEKPLENRWVSNSTFEFGEGWYRDGFGKDNDTTVTQYRALAFVRGEYWVMFDIFSPCDRKEHSYDSWFHFICPEYKELPELNGVMSSREGHPALAVIPVRKDAPGHEVICGQEKPEVQGWVKETNANEYGCRPVSVPVFHRKASGQVVEPYIFYPVKTGCRLPVKRIRSLGPCEYEIVFRNGRKDRISFDVEGDRIGNLVINGESL